MIERKVYTSLAELRKDIKKQEEELKKRKNGSNT